MKMEFVKDLFNLSGKVAVVIGGGGTLGGCMAEGLAKSGAEIAILDSNFENAQKQSDIIKSIGVKSVAFQEVVPAALAFFYLPICISRSFYFQLFLLPFIHPHPVSSTGQDLTSPIK